MVEPRIFAHLKCTRQNLMPGGGRTSPSVWCLSGRTFQEASKHLSNLFHVVSVALLHDGLLKPGLDRRCVGHTEITTNYQNAPKNFVWIEGQVLELHAPSMAEIGEVRSDLHF